MAKNTTRGTWWQRRNRLEKALVVAFLILICLGLALFIYFMVKPSNKSNCVTMGCLQAAGLIVNYINRTVDPCDNFYDFACGGYLQSSLETGEVSPMNQLEEVTQAKLNVLITDPNTDDKVERPLRLMRQFYQTCMNIKAIDKRGRYILENVIEKLGNWPIVKQRLWKKNDFNWMDFMIKCSQLGLEYNQFIRIDADADSDNTGLYLLSIHPPSIDNIDARFEDSYIKLMTDIAVSMGAEAYTASRQLPGVLDLRKRLKSLIDDADAKGSQTTLKISELQQRIPWINWLEFLKNITRDLVKIDQNTYVILYGEEYFINLQNVISRIPENTQANYGIWTIIENFYMYLDKELREKFTKFRKNTSGEVTQTRDSFCLSEAKLYFPAVAEIAYVKEYTTPELIKDVNIMIAKIRKLIVEKVKKSKWIDEDTKIEAELRLNQIDTFVGWSRNVVEADFENITSLSVNKFNWRSDDIWDMVMMLKVRNMDEGNRLIHQNYTELVNRLTVYHPVMDVNAYYSQTMKTLIIPISILQQPFYDLNRPHYMNYGAIGSGIGHELTHGFSTQGIAGDYEAIGNWWTKTTVEKYKNVTKCLIEEYNNYPYHLEGFTKDGAAALDENLADFVGINLAYEAYQDWVTEHGAEEFLPGLNYTPNQIFWIVYGTFKCYQPLNGGGEVEEGQAHGVPSFGVVAGFRNSPHFARDFGCALGSYMNPSTKCQILP